jgi:HPt (histidine-containing phosphotransfer) domain-containing protein
MAIGITGIDEGIFLELMDGDEELFKAVITTFVEKTPASLARLSNPAKETLEDYAIHIHGLKGACASVCAEKARKMAFSLEQKSRAGDFGGILAENGPFLKYVEDLIVKLKDWLKNHQQ